MLSLTLNPENGEESDVAQFDVREAARGVVVNDNGHVALLHVSRDSYYKLPGGGIDPGEDREIALRRECVEEVGCAVTDIVPLGTVVEYRKFLQLKQISHCFMARIVGEVQAPQFTDHEKERGFEPPIWVSIDEALRLLRSSRAASLEGRAYILPRDIAILEEAKKHV